MSLEAKIDALTAAVVALTQVNQALLMNSPQTASATVPVAETPSFAAPAAPAAAMPPLPSFAAPVAPAAPTVPFHDNATMIAWVMDVYKQLGPKGDGIQTVISSLGVTNINDVKPEQYPALYAGIQALKA